MEINLKGTRKEKKHPASLTHSRQMGSFANVVCLQFIDDKNLFQL